MELGAAGHHRLFTYQSHHEKRKLGIEGGLKGSVQAQPKSLSPAHYRSLPTQKQLGGVPSMYVADGSIYQRSTVTPSSVHMTPPSALSTPATPSKKRRTSRVTQDEVVYAELTLSKGKNKDTGESQADPEKVVIHGAKSEIIYQALGDTGKLQQLQPSVASPVRYRNKARLSRPDDGKRSLAQRQSFPPRSPKKELRPVSVHEFKMLRSPRLGRRSRSRDSTPLVTSKTASDDGGLLSKLEDIHNLNAITYYHRHCPRPKAVASLSKSCVPDHSFLLRSEVDGTEVLFTMSMKQGSKILHVPLDITAQRVSMDCHNFVSVESLVSRHREVPVVYDGQRLGLLVHAKARSSR